jgi:hypothetical protein
MIAGSGGAGTGGRGTGGAGTGGAGTGGAGTGGAPADAARYNFEVDAQAWGTAAGSGLVSAIGRSTAEHFAGQASLSGSIAATAAGNFYFEVAPPVPAVPSRSTVTFHIHVPAAATAISSIEGYVLDSAFAYTATQVLAAALTLGAWNTVTLAVPRAAAPIIRMGVIISTSAAFTGTVYVDSINW